MQNRNQVGVSVLCSSLLVCFSICYGLLLTSCTVLSAQLAHAQGITQQQANVESPEQKPVAVIRLDKVTDLPSKWQQNVSLYIKGDVEMSEEHITTLANELRGYYAHWTVVVAQQVDDEVLNSQIVQGKTGLEAVQHVLGNGLMLLPRFQNANTVDNWSSGMILLVTIEPPLVVLVVSPAYSNFVLNSEAEVESESEAEEPFDGGQILKTTGDVRHTVISVAHEMEQRFQTARSKKDVSLGGAVVLIVFVVVVIFGVRMLVRHWKQSALRHSVAVSLQRNLDEKAAGIRKLMAKRNELLRSKAAISELDDSERGEALRIVKSLSSLCLKWLNAVEIVERFRDGNIYIPDRKQYDTAVEEERVHKCLLDSNISLNNSWKFGPVMLGVFFSNESALEKGTYENSVEGLLWVIEEELDLAHSGNLRTLLSAISSALTDLESYITRFEARRTDGSGVRARRA